MLLEILTTLVLSFFFGYAAYVLCWTKADPGMGGPIEAFIAAEDDIEASRKHNCSTNKYKTKYEELGKQILILYGTEYGFSEEVARKVFDTFVENEECVQLDIQPRVVNARDYKLIEFDKEQVVLFVFSTTGDGVPPGEAREFMDHIKGAEMKNLLSNAHYSVLALGDSCYPHFCSTGRTLDARLKELAINELCPRVDVDQEDWEAIGLWIEAARASMVALELSTATDYLDLSQQVEDTGYSRTQPFWATISVHFTFKFHHLQEKYMLTSMNCEKDKETVHVEVDILGSDMTYTAGDALGIIPQNCPTEVDSLLQSLHCSGRELVPTPSFCYSPKPQEPQLHLREALIKYFDLKVVKMELVKLLVEGVTSEEEKEEGKRLLCNGLTKANSALSGYISSHEVIDVVSDFSTFTCSVEDILKQLKALQPRYYSIASSPLKNSDSVSVCAAVVRYSLLDRPRTGVCTTFLQDRCGVSSRIPVFISTNHDFRLPGKGDVPIIMIGPGTGLAPFRAFIQERVLTGASGQSVLYFGCRHRDQDFLYHNELEGWASTGVIKLRLAFSRDQRQKVYVQHLIQQDAQLLWDLIGSGGAHVYVCGDAKHMAVDVHQALLRILEEKGGKSPSEAAEYMSGMEAADRYQRDVWVT